MRPAFAAIVWTAALCSLACGPAGRPPSPAPTRDGTALSPSTRQASVTGRVAITIDDIGLDSANNDSATTQAIVRSLLAVQAPVAVFANCAQLESQALALWRNAEVTFGNHTHNHLDIDKDPSGDKGLGERWWEEVVQCDRRLEKALGRRVRYFRFPYLRYGRTAERRDEAARRLKGLGYRVAHVTAATSEWLLAEYYDRAIAAGNQGLADQIARAFVQHMVQTLMDARSVTREKTGREAAQITLLHPSPLVAHHLLPALEALQQAGWQFISLNEALADPLYARADEYIGGCGCSWLARIRPALSYARGDRYIFGDYEEEFRRRFDPLLRAE